MTGNLVETLHAAANGRLDAPFLVVPGGTSSTYGEIFERAAALATVLQTHGVAPGDRVVSRVDKSVDAVVLYLACLHAGAVHVPVNPAGTDRELDYFVGDADPALVIDDGRLAALCGAAADAAPAPLHPCDGEALAALLYTSGTTGDPKGAALTHDNLRHNAAALHHVWRFSPDDRLLHSLPIFHVHGLFVALHTAMLSAAPLTFLPRFDPAAVIEALPEATVFMGVPTHYRRLLDDPSFDRDTAAGIRLFTSGSAPLTPQMFAEFHVRTGQRICERYGMSECGIITSNPYDGDRIAGTVGFALPGVELRCEQDGVIQVRGPHLFSGYWGRPEATADVHRDGWFLTGDLGTIDAEGRVTITGRAGDMIISGGENIAPKEIELVLDAVDGVTESAVVGVPHPDFGEAVVAVLVVSRADPPVEPALEASLARFKHPKAVFEVTELPRNTMGKVQKAVLRARYASTFIPPDDAANEPPG